MLTPNNFILSKNSWILVFRKVILSLDKMQSNKGHHTVKNTDFQW